MHGLLDAVRREELDRLVIPPKPLDVLAQQIRRRSGLRRMDEEELYDLLRRPGLIANSRGKNTAKSCRCWRKASRRAGPQTRIDTSRRGQPQIAPARRAAAHRRDLRGTIPDTADYAVVLSPQEIIVGTVNEDFAVESLAGRRVPSSAIRRIASCASRRDACAVEDAEGMPPSIPFWLGEAPARSDEVSFRYRDARRCRCRLPNAQATLDYLVEEVGVARCGCASGGLPGQRKAALGLAADAESCVERFSMKARHPARHSFALRQSHQPRLGPGATKRFCRKFNFELRPRRRKTPSSCR